MEMTSRRMVLRAMGGSLALPLIGSVTRAEPPAASGPLDYVCPMHPDIRSDKPGVCPRCGMTLKLGVADVSEYLLELTTTPSVLEAGRTVRMKFCFKDPKTGVQVQKFEIMHEKLFHLFIVSSDLKYFLHDHPVPQPDGSFIFDHVFSSAGMYRLVADVYPSAGWPQLIPKTLFVNGTGPTDTLLPPLASLKPDLGTQHGENTDVSIRTIPEKPVAGARTLLFFRFNTAVSMEKYLGVWAHMLVASDDTIDLMHEHPVAADGGTEMQFAFVFPRPHTYRIWLQFQRSGALNTIAFNQPVITLENAEGVNTTA
jgi:hypothetical protein